MKKSRRNNKKLQVKKKSLSASKVRKASVNHVWDSLINACGKFSDDFMVDRDQGIQER
jgi:hypothetical protein